MSTDTQADEDTTRYVCPYCRLSLNIPLDYLGETGKCNKCGRRITVPSDVCWFCREYAADEDDDSSVSIEMTPALEEPLFMDRVAKHGLLLELVASELRQILIPDKRIRVPRCLLCESAHQRAVNWTRAVRGAVGLLCALAVCVAMGVAGSQALWSSAFLATSFIVMVGGAALSALVPTDFTFDTIGTSFLYRLITRAVRPNTKSLAYFRSFPEFRDLKASGYQLREGQRILRKR